MADPQQPDPPDPRDPLAPDPALDVTLDTAVLRVLAHPTRLALLGRLRQRGPATAGQLAEHFGLDSGAASYHLRRLAVGGLIEEDEALGNRRDRWWRALHRRSYHDPGAAAPAERQQSRSYTQAVAMHYGNHLHEVATQVVPALPYDWLAATIFADYPLHLTPGELDELKRELVTVVSTYRDRRSAGAQPVSLQLQAFPLLDPPG